MLEAINREEYEKIKDFVESDPDFGRVSQDKNNKISVGNTVIGMTNYLGQYLIEQEFLKEIRAKMKSLYYFTLSREEVSLIAKRLSVCEEFALQGKFYDLLEKTDGKNVTIVKALLLRAVEVFDKYSPCHSEVNFLIKERLKWE